MYPMLLLCLHQLLPLVIAEIGCEGLRASRIFEKCTMRILVNCLSFELLLPRPLFTVTETLRPGEVRNGRVRLWCFACSWHRYSNWDGHVYTFSATYHRRHRSVPAQSHARHGKELFPGLLHRQTRVETLATRPRAWGFSVIEGALRVHCSGFPHFSSPYSFSFN
jgi:hypothetical protein